VVFLLGWREKEGVQLTVEGLIVEEAGARDLPRIVSLS
jgi:hypothetical protein